MQVINRLMEKHIRLPSSDMRRSDRDGLNTDNMEIGITGFCVHVAFGQQVQNPTQIATV